MARFTESGMNKQSSISSDIMQCLSFITFMLSQTISALLWTLIVPSTHVCSKCCRKERKKEKKRGGGREEKTTTTNNINNSKKERGRNRRKEKKKMLFLSHLDTVCRHLCSENTDHSARRNSQRGVAHSHYTGRICCLRL